MGAVHVLTVYIVKPIRIPEWPACTRVRQVPISDRACHVSPSLSRKAGEALVCVVAQKRTGAPMQIKPVARGTQTPGAGIKKKQKKEKHMGSFICLFCFDWLLLAAPN